MTLSILMEDGKLKKVCTKCYEYANWKEEKENWVCSECGAKFEKWTGIFQVQHNEQVTD